MFKDLFSLLFPQNCINCNTSLISSESYLCTSCKIDLPVTNDYTLQENELFKKFAFQPKIKNARAFIYFNKGGMAQKLLHELKYKGKKQVGIEMGKWFAPQLNDLEIDHIIPVPIHSSKQRMRGYNQSDFLASGLSDELDVEYRTDLVKRTKMGKTQTKKSKVKRWSDLENVYSEASEQVCNKKILVIDDVITTGATIGMLCERLAEKDVNSIYVASIARGK